MAFFSPPMSALSLSSTYIERCALLPTLLWLFFCCLWRRGYSVISLLSDTEVRKFALFRMIHYSCSMISSLSKMLLLMVGRRWVAIFDCRGALCFRIALPCFFWAWLFSCHFGWHIVSSVRAVRRRRLLLRLSHRPPSYYARAQLIRHTMRAPRRHCAVFSLIFASRFPRPYVVEVSVLSERGGLS